MEILRKNSPSATLFNRRGFLTGVGATLLQGALIQSALSRFASAQNLGGYPFTLGVASGDPLPDGIVLWTRLAPDPLRGGGMPHHPIAVQWQIATDDSMKKIVKRGATVNLDIHGCADIVRCPPSIRHRVGPSASYRYRLLRRGFGNRFPTVHDAVPSRGVPFVSSPKRCLFNLVPRQRGIEPGTLIRERERLSPALDPLL